MLDKTKNYKIDITWLTLEEQINLQAKLFNMGYEWYDGIEMALKYRFNFLFLDGKSMTYCNDEDFFRNKSATTITVSDIMPQTIELPTITLRDYFAGQALFGLMAMFPLSDVQVAKRAYQYADAMIKERATHNTHSVPPSDSKTEKVYGVVGEPKNAVQPVFHIGDKIRFKSTGDIEKISTIPHGGRYINSVNVEDVELIKES